MRRLLGMKVTTIRWSDLAPGSCPNRDILGQPMALQQVAKAHNRALIRHHLVAQLHPRETPHRFAKVKSFFYQAASWQKVRLALFPDKLWDNGLIYVRSEAG